jgi:hypothetical protein
MIELSYAEIFLFVVILTLLGLWIKAILEFKFHKLITMRALEAIHEGKAELYHDGEQVNIRKVENNG